MNEFYKIIEEQGNKKQKRRNYLSQILRCKDKDQGTSEENDKVRLRVTGAMNSFPNSVRQLYTSNRLQGCELSSKQDTAKAIC